ncbi:hypothetical protein LPJ66_010322 [Kickxella alabastrina]|uniref:Uncharacterized protein n=1 Tax=Kickxella alabastrina TaxID=61397 RepID=A0ACC1I4J4_9FUNG|nr:hypothetical protein LPJ66_010322 [Kickxella alabastrina]
MSRGRRHTLSAYKCWSNESTGAFLEWFVNDENRCKWEMIRKFKSTSPQAQVVFNMIRESNELLSEYTNQSLYLRQIALKTIFKNHTASLTTGVLFVAKNVNVRIEELVMAFGSINQDSAINAANSANVAVMQPLIASPQEASVVIEISSDDGDSGSRRATQADQTPRNNVKRVAQRVKLNKQRKKGRKTKKRAMLSDSDNREVSPHENRNISSELFNPSNASDTLYSPSNFPSSCPFDYSSPPVNRRQSVSEYLEFTPQSMSPASRNNASNSDTRFESSASPFLHAKYPALNPTRFNMNNTNLGEIIHTPLSPSLPPTVVPLAASPHLTAAPPPPMLLKNNVSSNNWQSMPSTAVESRSMDHICSAIEYMRDNLDRLMEKMGHISAGPTASSTVSRRVKDTQPVNKSCKKQKKKRRVE